ncbi:MAG: AI-2E family transporter [Clostridium sp.]|jgi:sporulation integral membrane protein YtvI|uniref:AI-2E family transporter n=1 Tax=Clostridium sp. AM49-4BH TaxID=2293035 RepID=UPI000334C535|nr:AI-2E family transporter [Clostridium sp. AM49-4BH]RHQ11600.1 AI-2E family transporter [Clostridium sp. AM49-4BH]CCZ51867.1 sporulation integral membrane protein YtvI [Clostridium sp. CAG:75]
MNAHPLLRQLLIITFISGAVLLSFKYVLPLIFPFLFAYTLMRSLMPIVLFLQKKCHLPKWLAANGTLLLISLAFLGVFLLIGWLLFQQCKLLLTNLSIYHQIYTKSIESCCHNILQHLDYYLGLQKGSCLIFAKEQFHNLDPSSFTNLYQNIGRIALQCMGSSMRVCAFLLIVIVSFIVLCKDYDHLHTMIHKNRYFSVLSELGHTMWNTGFAYMRSQLIIIGCNWAICTIAFLLIRNPYCIVIGLFISIFDAFPILGSGMILIPWGLVKLFHGSFFAAAVLLTAYLLTVFTRELLEARLIGSNLNTLPFFTLASIYIGISLYGVCGIFLGPFAVVLIRSIYQIWMRSA